MYNLSPRFAKLGKGGVPPNIGPDTYVLCEDAQPRINRIPFLSSAERKFAIGRKIYTHAIYNPEEEYSRRIPGGASLRNRAQRLKYSRERLPGPGDYDPKLPRENCNKYIPPPVHGNGRLYVCRVPYSVMASAPSVPSKIDANGYDIDREGNIVKVPPDVYDTSRGPAYYNVPRGDFCWTTQKYHHCCQWSKSKAKRGALKISDTPPPNIYDPKINPCTSNPIYEEYRSLARLFGYIPRFTEGEMLRQLAEDKPGPGHYTIDNSSFKCRPSLSVVPRPMVAGVKRFKSTLQDTPGPGEYEICDCPTKKRDFSLKEPIAVQALRFSSKKAQDFPGPGAYDLKGPIQEKLDSKKHKYSFVDVPFCQTAERKIGALSKHTASIPGPGEYDVESAEVEKEPVYASVFKSGTIRGQTLRRPGNADPGSYNVTEAFNKNRNRTSHNAGKVPFQSSQPRLPGHKGRVTPGPADYISQGKPGEKGSTFSNIPRFKNLDNGIPPVGLYNVHPSFASAIYKASGTHNLRLKENVTRTKLRLSPGTTWQKWIGEMNKNKKLRWFSKPTADYQHCIRATSFHE